MHQDNGVIVHIDNPRVRGGRLCHLMGVAGRRQPGADVKELADSALRGQETHHAGQERPIRPRIGGDPGVNGQRLLGGVPVRSEVVLATQPVVINAGGMGVRRIELQRPFPGTKLFRHGPIVAPRAPGTTQGSRPLSHPLAVVEHDAAPAITLIRVPAPGPRR